jgi:tol-pal system protein YbgF
MRRWSLAGLLLFGLACVSSEDMDRMSREMGALRGDVQGLQKDLATRKDVQSVVAGVEAQTQKLVRSNADMAMKMNDFAGQVESLQTQLKETNARLSKLSQQIAETQKALAQARTAPPISTAPVPPEGGTPAVPSPVPSAPPTSPQDPSELYKESYQDFLQGRYDIAVQGFQDFLKAAPDSDLADDAWFYAAESHFNQKKYKEALANYEKLLALYSKSDRAPAARLKKGLTHIELGNKTLGIVELQYCMYEYPDSEEAQKAKEKLETLGISAR